MTLRARLRRIGAPLASAAVTAAALIGALWIQHDRGAWPFGQVTPVSTPERMEHGAVPVRDTSMLDRMPIEVAPSTLANLGVRLEAVRRETVAQTVQAVATVVPDESRISHVHTRVAGWVEQLDVNTTGELVQRGQPLARIFSQELLSSQTEYLAARRATIATGITSAVVASGRTRLTVLGMTPDEIAAIEQSGEPRRLVTVVAPRSGVVVNRGVTVGTAVDPSTPLLTIVDLSSVWVFAEVPEASIAVARLGTSAQLDFPASGRGTLTERVDFLYPTLTERTRTLRARFNVANTGGALRPGLYGTATFRVPGVPAVTVSRDAVINTGRRQYVFVAVGDRFEPRPVTLGIQLADRVEVLAGLREDELVVSSGVFLLDSESRLRATGSPAGHGHAATPTSEKPTPAPPSAHSEHRE